MPRRTGWTMVALVTLIMAARSLLVPTCLRGAELATARNLEPLGVMAVSGSVEVDQVPAPAATTVFAGDTVRTEADSAAVVKFRSGTTVSLEGKGEVVLPVSRREEDLQLREGVLTVRSARGRATRVKVRGRSVKVGGQEGAPAVALIRARGQSADVWTKRGKVEVESRGRRVRVEPGKVAGLGEMEFGKRRLAAGAAAGAGEPKAGTVSGAIPAETVQKGGQGPALPLKVRDDVHWQDVVKTEQRGRVRIALLDGSVLNIGARSQMRIVEHNAQTEQTEIEMTLGRMRSHVVKLTKKGSSFEVKTQTAVIGVVGTIFVVVSLPTQTQVFCLEGVVTVRNIDPAVRGRVRVRQNQSTTVAEGLPPTPPVAMTPAEVQFQMSETNVPTAPTTAGAPGPGQPGGPAAGGAAGGAGGGGVMATGPAAGGAGAGGGLFSSVPTVVGAAAGVTSLAAGVAAAGSAGDARDALNESLSALQTATSTANAATVGIINSQQQSLSPAQPCGCQETPP